MHVLIILSSIREARKTHHLAHYLKRKISDRGIKVQLLDLQKVEIPAFGTSVSDPMNIDRIREYLLEADALIFVSPEYHQSYSSTLKNFSEYYWSEFGRKPIGVATASAGKLGGVHASIQMQALILALGGYPIPTRLMAPEIHNLFDVNNQPIHKSFVEKTEFFLDEFISFSEKIVIKAEEKFA